MKPCRSVFPMWFQLVIFKLMIAARFHFGLIADWKVIFQIFKYLIDALGFSMSRVAWIVGRAWIAQKILVARTFVKGHRKIATEFLIFLFLVWVYLRLNCQFIFETNHYNYCKLFNFVNIRLFLRINFFGIENCWDLFTPNAYSINFNFFLRFFAKEFNT